MITLHIIFLAPYLMKKYSFFTYFSFELPHIIVLPKVTEILSLNISDLFLKHSQ